MIMNINLIVCVDSDYGIAKNGMIPWHYKSDLQYFKELTMYNIIIMGYNTFISLPNQKPLKNRLHIVLTTKNISTLTEYDNVIYFNSISDILNYLNNNKETNNNIWVIGGVSIYNAFLKLQIINKIYMTVINDKIYNCDKFFNIKYLKYFTKESNINIKDSDKNKFQKKSYNGLIEEIKQDVLSYIIYRYNNKEESTYLYTIDKILHKGIYKLDRTNIGTLSLFGKSFKYNIKNYRLPLFTHRKMFVRGIIEELLFFISGKTDTKILENKKVNIWKGNTSREFLDSRNLQHLKEGDMGAGYSFQLRHFGANYINAETDYTYQGFDQLKYVIDLIKNDPNSRRILFSYWNPCDLDKVALPSCFIENTLVLTEKGYKKIQNISTDDTVYTHKGNWKKVNNIQRKNYKGNLYILNCYANNKLIKTTEEHPFYVCEYIKDDKRFIKTNKFSWCKAKDLNIYKHLLCCPINKNKSYKTFQFTVDDNEITIELNEDEFYYHLGYYLKKGYYMNDNYYLTIHHKDIKYLADKLKCFKLEVYIDQNDKTTYKILNKYWYPILKEFTFANNTHIKEINYNKVIPEWIQDLPDNALLNFLNGYNNMENALLNELYTNKSYIIHSKHVAFSLQRIYAKLRIYIKIEFLPYYNNEKFIYKLTPDYRYNHDLIDDNYIYFVIKHINKKYKEIPVYNFEVADDNSYIVQNITVHNCHILYQFYTDPEKKELSCSFYQRSSDFVLAADFNIVSAAMLTFMICHLTGYKPKKLIHNIGDIHIYKSHIEETKKILKNKPLPFPICEINDPDNKIKNIEDFTIENFKILLYNSYDRYKFTMAV
jgi:dihydrofolate reductase / thymidylate synthase